jgi:putative N-acetylmannosamine-6-phosphate epimerase
MILPRGLIVSCQARKDNPMHGAIFMAAMAQAAVLGGAVAIRANGSEDIAAICGAVDVPVIGIHKVFQGDKAVYITPTIAAARAVIAAGARVVAFDATDRSRAGDAPAAIMAAIHAAGADSFADVATLAEGLAAGAMGARYVSTTLSGYTESTAGRGPGPDLDLLAALAAQLSVPVVAEGRFNTPDLVRAALAAGAHAVVVGTMITNPTEITRAFARALPGRA